jgi:hypothetical protein
MNVPGIACACGPAIFAGGGWDFFDVPESEVFTPECRMFGSSSKLALKSIIINTATVP